MSRTRRNIVAGFVALAATTAGVVAIESPAHAAFGPCYNRGSYSFEDGTDAINIYSGSGCGTYMGFILATPAGGGKVTLDASDRRCDNKGFTLYVHGYSVASGGCNTDKEKTVTYSSIGSPKNMWAYVANSVNSNAVNLPAA